jgi:phosphate transport system substrate-binding protein
MTNSIEVEINLMRNINALLAALITCILSGNASAELQRDYLMIVGSTSVYPFSTLVMDQYIKQSGAKAPLAQATGSGGGLMLFCAGTGAMEPDITYASRRIRKSEFDTCQRNGVKEIVEVKIGYDGIVLAQSGKATPLKLGLKDIYTALGKEIPDPGGADKMVPNPHKTWKDVNGDLPDRVIEVLGPSRGSGTRTIFTNLAMEDGCEHYKRLMTLKYEDRLEFRTTCRTFRDDGAYIQAGEDDNQTLENLETNLNALAILSFGVLERNSDRIQGISINGVAPDFNTIADDSYPLERPLYLYVKKAHVGKVPGIREFLAEFTSEKAWGKDGYLSEHGLVPMRDAERRKYADAAKNLTPMSM